MTSLPRRHYLFVLIIILFFATVTRLYNLASPKEYVFDEVYHAITAKLIARNDPRAYEWWNPPVEPDTAVDWLHPPLAKYTQALSMKIFGENSFGWRLSSAIFGVLVIAATAKLADLLFHDKRVALFAAASASLDGLLLVQSRVAMNDIHVTFFILLTLICYTIYRQRKKKSLKVPWIWLFFTALSAGLAMGTKWSGIYILGVVILAEATYWICQTFQQTKKKKRHTFSLVRDFPSIFIFLNKHLSPFALLKNIPYFFILLGIPCIIYLLSYSHMFLQGKTLFCQGTKIEQGKCYCRQESSWWVNFLKKYGPSNEWLWQTAKSSPIIWNNLPNLESVEIVGPQLPNFWENLEARGGCMRLISHFSELHYQIFYYQTHLTATHTYQSRPLDWFLDLRPVWFYTHSTADTALNIYTFGNPAVFWFGDAAVFISIAYLLVQLWKYFDYSLSKQKNKVNIPLLLVLVSYAMMWVPWQLSPRIMFFYHYTPAVPLLSIILGYWLARLSNHEIKIQDEKVSLEYVAYTFVLIMCIFFALWYPNWIGLPVSKEFADKVYFIVQSWQ